MVMPKRKRFIMGLTLAAGGAVIASGATAPAAIDAKKPPNGGKVAQNSGHGLDWEKVAQPKRPPNG